MGKPIDIPITLAFKALPTPLGLPFGKDMASGGAG